MAARTGKARRRSEGLGRWWHDRARLERTTRPLERGTQFDRPPKEDLDLPNERSLTPARRARVSMPVAGAKQRRLPSIS